MHNTYFKGKKILSGLSYKSYFPYISKFFGHMALICGLIYVVVVSFLVYGQLGLGSGFPAGFDSPGHISLILFISQNFPHIFWNPFSFSGYVNFPTSYPPLYHFSLAFINLFLGTDPVLLIKLNSLFSLILIVVSLYGIAWLVTRKVLFSVSLPLLFLTNFSFWVYFTAGGSYARIFGFSLYLLFLFILLLYLLIQKNKLKKLIYPFLVFTTCLSILSHLLLFILTFTTLFFLSLIFEKKKGIGLFIKTSVWVLGFTAFYFFPFIFLKTTSSSLVAPFLGDPNYQSASWRMILEGAYPGINLFLGFLAIIIFFIMVFTKEKTEVLAEGNFRHQFKLVYYFFTFLSLACLIYSLGWTGYFFWGVFPQNLLFILALFLCLSLIFSFAYLGNWLTNKIILISFVIIFSVTIFKNTSVLDRFKVQNQDSFMRSFDVSKLTDSSFNFRLAHGSPYVGSYFYVLYKGMQNRGAFEQGVVFPDYYFWLQNTLFEKGNNLKETEFLLDWFGIDKVYLGGNPKVSLADPINSKFYNSDDFSKAADSVFYRKKTPLFLATNTTPVFVESNDYGYLTILKQLAASGYSLDKVVPLRSVFWKEGAVGTAGSYDEVLKIVKSEKEATGSSKADLKTIYVNPEQFEVDVDSFHKGLIFKQSYFKNWQAHLVDPNHNLLSLKIYETGPGMMYVFLPKFNGSRRLVFTYGLSWEYWTGFLITFFTVIYCIYRPFDLNINRFIHLDSFKNRTFKSKKMLDLKLKIKNIIISFVNSIVGD